ncbi:MAG: M10 family metallopeptidase C-terminal domain-containing protein [Lyngbya sp.]|nr:M10 family metallopeptidase C-terminal domain-containing protein [Lyngbya sp.]
MSSQTLFLQPTGSTTETNFVEASADALFFNYSQPASGSLSSVELEALVSGGVAQAIASADATFINDPAFTSLFTEAFAEGEEEEYKVKNKSKAEVTATFEIPANESFSFDFLADISITAKEIENPDAEFSRARAKTTFLVLDTTDPDNPKILDYFGIRGRLISSENVATTNSRSSGNISFTTSVDRDINGNNGEDFLDVSILSGNYSRTFNSDTRISIVETNTTATKLLGDTYIDNLGSDVIYGSIWQDDIDGTGGADKIYGSANRDNIQGQGGNDILEGGGGRDRLAGNGGNDRIHGGDGRDVIIGGRGSDILAGGEGQDVFVFAEGNSFLRRELDIIQDFELGQDQVEFRNFGNFDPLSLLEDTGLGAILTLNTGGQLLFEGMSSNQLSNADFLFA